MGGARPPRRVAAPRPASAQCMASGHQSRLASATGAIVGDRPGTRPRARRARGRRAVRPREGGGRCPPARSVRWVRCAGSCDGGSCGRAAVRCGGLVGARCEEVPHLLLCGRRRPNRVRRRAARRRRVLRRRRRRGRTGGRGAPGEHVVERRRHLVARRVHDFGTQVRVPGHDRLAQRPVGGDEGADVVGERAVPTGEVRTRRPVGRGAAAGRRSRRSRLVRQRPDRPSRTRTASTVSSAISRYVVSLPPVTVRTPLGERCSAVAARQVGRAARRRPPSPAAADRPRRR